MSQGRRLTRPAPTLERVRDTTWKRRASCGVHAVACFQRRTAYRLGSKYGLRLAPEKAAPGRNSELQSAAPQVCKLLVSRHWPALENAGHLPTTNLR